MASDHVSALPDAAHLERFIGRVRTRLLVLRAIEGASIGCVTAALTAAAGPRNSILLASIVVFGAALRVALGDEWRFKWWRSRTGLARRVERRTAVGRNLVVTATELLESRQVAGYVHRMVLAGASRVTARLDPATLFPSRRALSALAAGLVVLAASMLRSTAAESSTVESTRPTGPASVSEVEVVVTPPGYTGLATERLVNPSRVDALANSRIDVRVSANAGSVRLETIGGTLAMRPAEGGFVATLTAESHGYLAVEPRDSAGNSGQRYLIGLVVTADRSPRVMLTSPGRDLFFSTVPATLPVSIAAEDDLGVASLRLRFTAVSGSGERFTFTEREVPLALSRVNPRAWTATGTWQLSELGLSPGDLVVYRAVATDRRPGSLPVESESYVIEVVTPGAIAAEGFAADDQRDRYAVSQQMVILKTERLIARRAALPADSIVRESRLLAAEQRQVRAEFVFMMGGEIEDAALETAGTLELDEVAEAEAEGDLLAGRLQNQGRQDMTRAIRAMSRASTALTEAGLDQALRDERVALENLMRAFSRTRFILRALTQRERIDLDRRLGGALELTAGLSGPVASAAVPEQVVRLRRLLANIAALATDSGSASADRASLGALALLRANPASDTLRSVAARIEAVATQVRSRQVSGLRLRVDSLLGDVARLATGSLPVAPRRAGTLQGGQLAGALRDAASRVGPPR
jgi:hypothetical protein